MSNTWKDIGTLLLEYGLISNDDLAEGVELQKKSDLRLGEALVQLGKVSMDDIEWVLSKQLDIPFIIVEDITPNIELLNKFQKDFLIVNRVLPLYETDDQISVAIEDPFNSPAIEFIRESFDKELNISTGSGSKIKELLKNTFKKIGIPVLVDAVKGIMDKVRETSFYRMDFILDEQACVIHVFGAGILKKMAAIKGHFSIEEVFTAFDDLDVPFLYEQSFSNGRRFMMIYPMTNRIDIERFPAVVSAFGLFSPEETVFADAHVHGSLNVFPFNRPVAGYSYFTTKRPEAVSGQYIYTIDTAPEAFEEFYLNAYVPGKCASCNGEGCGECNDLGHTFTKMEGVYSSDDLNKKLNGE